MTKEEFDAITKEGWFKRQKVRIIAENGVLKKIIIKGEIIDFAGIGDRAEWQKAVQGEFTVSDLVGCEGMRLFGLKHDEKMQVTSGGNIRTGPIIKIHKIG